MVSLEVSVYFAFYQNSLAISIVHESHNFDQHHNFDADLASDQCIKMKSSFPRKMSLSLRSCGNVTFTVAILQEIFHLKKCSYLYRNTAFQMVAAK